MAQSQPFPQVFAQQNKGTLVPGQMISVNKYTVQVERYLSQGGFAHVYLVRTSAPVYGTTHHVLKRIAVPNEAMLTEVKKEVDVMRILKGHPNIVHLIDAASHRMSNGAFEVFILMEFCSGGGIIDMMNRRLRERLTESEILTIFVNVCEGLAAMHALKPPLLHRDLKVENILQSSATSYKLCDFGSATPVGRVPTNSQEIRMLEADLNRHTTLQYRAPEMVDVYLRRPIDEKSDIWALGVLLYKLCYYTTPFEEHGPLAILNVQYKIPPYPAYSPQMQALIASMLREHGVHRPTVFEILNHVHHLRGTRSIYQYSVPPKQPPLPPRAVQAPPLQALSPNLPQSPRTNLPHDPHIPHKSRSQPSQPSPAPVPARNAGVEAREKVLDAIAPMRRGRPTAGHSREVSPPASPRKEKAPDSKTPQMLGADFKFGNDDRAWSIQGQKSGIGTGGSNTINLNTGGADDAWAIKGSEKSGKGMGFENDFSTLTKGFGDAFEPKVPPPAPPKPQLQSQPIPIPRPSPSPLPTSSRSPVKRVPVSRSHTRDAFEGLGLATQPPPQTLGEARRTRTGLASLGTPSNLNASQSANRTPSHYLNAPNAGGETTSLGTSNTMYRPPSAHSPAPPTSARPQPQPPQTPQMDSWRSHSSRGASSSKQSKDMTVEERFPSLEELDRQFGPPFATAGFPERPPSRTHASHSQSSDKSHPGRPPSRTTHNTGGMRQGSFLGINGTGSGAMQSAPLHGGGRFDGTRSQQVTGAAMRESKMPSRQTTTPNWGDHSSHKGHEIPQGRASTSERPPLTRKHRSSLSIKPSPQIDRLDSSSMMVPQTPPSLPPRPLPSPRQTPRDWLTGPDEDGGSAPVLRESPSKRASFIERSPVMIQKPLEAESVEAIRDWSAHFTDPEKEREREEAQRAAQAQEESRRRKAEQAVQAAKEREEERERGRRREAEKAREKERLKEKADQMEREREQEREKQKAIERERERQAKEAGRRREQQREDEKYKSNRERVKEQRGRSSPTKAAKTFAARTATGQSTGGRQLPVPPVVDTKSQSRSNSMSNGLTDNWSPVAVQAKPSASSSSGEDGPEEPNGFGLKERSKEKLKDHSKIESGRSTPLKGSVSKKHHIKGKTRQGSVHDLVDLWGGGVEKDKPDVVPPKTGDKRRAVLLAPPTPSAADPPGTATKPMFSPDPPETTPNTAGYILTSARPPSTHRRDGSTILTPPGYRALPVPIPVTSSSSQSGRSRPQSMIISPSKFTEPAVASALPVLTQTQQTLSPPVMDSKTIRRARRSSVSNVVQHYEAINTGNPTRPSQGPPPVTPSKPQVGLSTKVASVPLSTSTSNSSIPSPATAAHRYPRISPTASPVVPKANLAVPDDGGNSSSHRDSSRGRTSPSPSLSGLPSRATSSFIFPSKPMENNTGSGSISGLPPRRTSPFEPIKPTATASSTHTYDSSTTTIAHPFPVRKATLPPAEEKGETSSLRSPSPERPYQGVSRLIDRWQKAVDNSGEGHLSRGTPPRRVGSLSGRGR